MSDNLPATGALTEQRAAFVTAVAEGIEPILAAKEAGFSSPRTEAHRLLQSPQIRDALQKYHSGTINGELSALAIKTLRCLLTDTLVPAPVRLGAVKLTLALAGHSENPSDNKDKRDKPLHAMTEAELLAMADKLRQASRDNAKVVSGKDAKPLIIDG